VPSAGHDLTRDEKVENLIINFSMIMAGMFEGVFAALAEGLTTALTKTVDALTEAVDSADQGSGRRRRRLPAVDPVSEADPKVREVFSRLRKEVAEGFSHRNRSFRRFIKDTAFDEGVRIVESHNLGLPRLTEPLDDADLAGYVALMQNGDPEVVRMMQELGEWQKTTPRFGPSG